MYQLLLTALNSLEFRDTEPIPSPTAGTIRVKVLASAVGLLQAHLVTGRADTHGFPRVMGHEIVGLIDACGPDVTTFETGSLVVVDPVTTCGVCRPCLVGQETSCDHKALLGFDIDGGYSEFVIVQASHAFGLPIDTPLEQAIMLASAVPTAVHIVRGANVRPGDCVVVLGLGSIGMMVCQVARAFGAIRIIGADVNPARFNDAGPWIDAAVDVGQLSVAEAADRLRNECLAPHGADVVFETAGKKQALDVTFGAVRNGGTVLCVGAIDGNQAITFADYFRDFVLRELEIKSTSSFSMSDFDLAIRLYSARRVDVRGLIGDVIRLEDVPEAIADVVKNGSPQGKRHVVRFR